MSRLSGEPVASLIHSFLPELTINAQRPSKKKSPRSCPALPSFPGWKYTRVSHKRLIFPEAGSWARVNFSMSIADPSLCRTPWFRPWQMRGDAE